MCEVQQEVGGRSEAGRRGRGQREGAGTRAGVGSSQPTAGLRAVGALSAAPSAGVEGWGVKSGKEQFEGRTRQGQRAHPWPSPAT